MPISSAEHLTNAMSSASAELSVTWFCVFDQPFRNGVSVIDAVDVVTQSARSAGQVLQYAKKEATAALAV